MTPGQLRNNPAHWQPCDRRITDHEPDHYDGSIVVAVAGMAIAAAGVMTLIAALVGWLS